MPHQRVHSSKVRRMDSKNLRHLAFPLVLATTLLAAACGKSGKTIDHGMIAARAAKVYYESLIAGKSALFMDGILLPDTIPGSYRDQMLMNFRQFCDRMEEQHHGIDSISIHHTEFNGRDSTANAYLLFHFGDGGREQIVVPMVKKKGLWYMR